MRISDWSSDVCSSDLPQTRDAKLRADVVPLAADVSGRVDEVFASDNEEVRKGQVLFTIDKARLSNEVEQAAAAVATAAAQLHAAEREDKRYRTLSDVVSSQELDTRHSAAQEARARHDQALANRALARIKLERDQVRT